MAARPFLSASRVGSFVTSFIRKQDAQGRIGWTAIADAIEAGHRLPRAVLRDAFIEGGHGTLLNRAAWVDGLGFCVKAASIMGGNAAKGLPTVHSAVMLFGDREGQVEAVIEGDLVTDFKTAGDSALGARLLARPDSRHLLLVGAGTVAENLARAYSEIFPGLARISIWNRSPERARGLAERLAGEGYPAVPVADLPAAAGEADMIGCATMAREPVLLGEWVRPGTHVDLIGAFKADMREADDALLQKGRLFVDSRESTIGHIGELMIPLASGAISEDDVLGDLYDLVGGAAGRRDAEEITVYKNGGGGHLDLMTAKAILRLVEGGD